MMSLAYTIICFCFLHIATCQVNESRLFNKSYGNIYGYRRFFSYNTNNKNTVVYLDCDRRNDWNCTIFQNRFNSDGTQSEKNAL